VEETSLERGYFDDNLLSSNMLIAIVETTELLVMKIESVETTNQILAICVVLYVCLIIIVMVIVILDDNKLMTDYGKENYRDLYSTQSIIRLTPDNRKWNIFFWVFIPKI
jgi:hypothetical protein